MTTATDRLSPFTAAERQSLARALVGERFVIPGVPGNNATVVDQIAGMRDGQIGLVAVSWPGIAWPIWVRSGARDRAELTAAMTMMPADRPLAPRHIVEIGAGAGYRSIALAKTWPGATIASVEPMPAVARLHSLNTLPWRQIIGIRAAISGTGGTFAVEPDAATGGARLVRSPNGIVGALSMPGLLQHLGWDAVDLVLIDHAAHPDPLDAPTMAILACTQAVAFRHSIAEMADVFTATGHIQQPHQGWTWYIRPNGPKPTAQARLHYLFDVGGSAVPATTVDVANAAWACFPIGDTGFRLHPNEAGAAPARLIVRHHAFNPSRFETKVRLSHASSRPVRFKVAVTTVDHARAIGAAEIVLRGGTASSITFDLERYAGDVLVEFSTEMAHGDGNHHAWAEFLEPVFRD